MSKSELEKFGSPHPQQIQEHELSLRLHFALNVDTKDRSKPLLVALQAHWLLCFSRCDWLSDQAFEGVC